MQDNITITELVQNQKSDRTEEIALFVSRFRNGIWLFGIPSWLFGISNISFSALTDGYWSATEIIQLFTACLLFISWLFLKPEYLDNNDDAIALQGNYCTTHTLKSESKQKYIVSQEHFLSKEYILPGSYWANMFHMMNPFHLNNVHKITQNGIKITEVTQYRETELGGILTFSSVRDPESGLITNIRTIIEYIPVIKLLNKYIDMLISPDFTYQLILHSPYTTEIYIPAGKYYTSAVFYVHPIEQNKCKIFIDFYSNLPIPKICKFILFQIVIPIVIWEDKSYLLKLSKKDPDFFRKIRRKVPDNHFLRLNQRFIELYGSQNL